MSAESQPTPLSTAAQFFMDEEEGSTSTYDRVVELVNQATLMQKDVQKIGNLRQVQELIVHKEPGLLDNFLEEMLAFQSDKGNEVRKFIVSFIEEACKKEPDLLDKCMPCLQVLLQDENVNVQKKTILVLPNIYRTIVWWLIKSKPGNDEEKSFVWESMKAMKNKMYELIDSENDGIRTHVVKFFEGYVLALSRKTSESEVPKGMTPEKALTLDDIPNEHKFLKLKRLEEEGTKGFDIMLRFQASPHISSINLMTVMGSITTIAKQRPDYFSKVVQAFEALQVNLPPTLAKSQVSSVRKNLKMHMLSLLRHPASQDYIPQITTLLTDLGATNSEVMKSMPKIDESRKRKAEEASAPAKKAKVEIEQEEDYLTTPFVERGTTSVLKQKPADLQHTAIDITSNDLYERLTPHNVADLVLISMVMLPETMPAHFQSTYTPIAAAGTEAQKKHMARLLATQLTTAGMGKGIREVQKQQSDTSKEDGSASPEYQPTSPKQTIQTVVGGLTAQEIEDHIISRPSMPAPMLPVKRGIKIFKLGAITQPLDRDRLDNMTASAFKRILKAEKNAAKGNALQARTKLLASLTSQFGGELKNLLQEYIFEDLRTHSDLAFAWLYQEYANCQGFCASSLGNERLSMASYDECLTRLLSGLMERPEHPTQGLFHRLLLEAPAITDNALEILRRFFVDESKVVGGMNTLKDLILTRPEHRLRFLGILLESCSHEKPEVRGVAIRVTKKLYENENLCGPIEKYAQRTLKLLLDPKPPPEIFGNLRNKEFIPDAWTEDVIKMCLYLYLGLLPCNHKLIHELAVIYTGAIADIKRTILRTLETPVKGMGMQSPELLTLVESCPKGAETLVTRVIHILTDKATPSPELVERVRDLYHKRVPDVRFLIPVLNGLTKSEVIAALSKLIKLNPIVVKEVFNRLLGHGDAAYNSPLSPVELLIALHNIDPTKCDMKTIIKATNLCFSEKNIYTQEVLAVVMKTLMEQTPIPTLFMRTVLQSLSMYPRIIGFVLNILQRLITKQVWKQKKVWEGFIRCCQRTKPQSFAVMLQLPAPQLKSVFDTCPELREPLLDHVNTFTAHQKACIPRTIMNVLEKDPEEEKRKQEEKRNIEEGQNFIMLQPHQIKLEKTDSFEPASQFMPPPKDVTEIRTVQVLSDGNRNMDGDRQRQEAEKQRSSEEIQQDDDRRKRDDDRRKEDERRKRDEKRSTESRRVKSDRDVMMRDVSPENTLAIAEEPMDTTDSSSRRESRRDRPRH
ncbi:symplekin-like isoform X2 [Mytilus galloprovincialis]|uniref:symplekin-like isoform X2 n=1 Tax=Mytilus galloprovincialis TaxID=29158 RepID=UPI003F7C33F6